MIVEADLFWFCAGRLFGVLQTAATKKRWCVHMPAACVDRDTEMFFNVVHLFVVCADGGYNSRRPNSDGGSGSKGSINDGDSAGTVAAASGQWMATLRNANERFVMVRQCLLTFVFCRMLVM